MFALLVVSSRAAAAEDADAKEAISFELSAPDECPSETWMLGQIRAYTRRWTLAAPGKQARRFVLRIGRRDGLYAGRFDLHEPSGAATSREIEGESCEDAAVALAVAVAIAIDPQASLAPSELPPEEEPLVPAPPAPPAEPPRDERAPRARSIAATRPPPPISFAVGGRAGVNGAVSGVLGVVELFGEVAWKNAFRRIASLEPALRVGFRQAFPRVARAGESRLEMAWSAGYFEACPARFAPAPTIAIDGCFGTNIGVLSAEALGIAGAGTTRRLWLDYGPVLGARWLFHSGAFIEGAAAMWVPLRRDRFRVEPDGVISQAPKAGLSFGLGGGWRF